MRVIDRKERARRGLRREKGGRETDNILERRRLRGRGEKK